VAHRRLRHSYPPPCVARYFYRTDLQGACAGRYRERIPLSQPLCANSLFVTISQSGETADPWLRCGLAKQSGYLSSLSICNVPESSLVRESELVCSRVGVRNRRGIDQGFHGRSWRRCRCRHRAGKTSRRGCERERGLVSRLIELPSLVERTLELDSVIHKLAERFAITSRAVLVACALSIALEAL